MAARRCSSCSRNYALGVGSCPSCGGQTWHVADGTPDDDADAQADDPTAGVFSANSKVDGWRFDEFVRLGLDLETAERAALERQTADEGTPGGYRVDLHDFARLIDRGATAPQAFGILY